MRCLLLLSKVRLGGADGLDHETWDISPSGAGEVALVSSGMLFVGAHEVAIACFRADRVTLTQSCANGVGSISPARDPLKAG